MALTPSSRGIIRRNSPRETFQPPSGSHWLGTDQFGRDMLSRIIYGSRISLAVGLSSVLLAIFVGVPLGIISGFYGGKSMPSSCGSWG